jgi:hypothetical protein
MLYCLHVVSSVTWNFGERRCRQVSETQGFSFYLPISVAERLQIILKLVGNWRGTLSIFARGP